MTPNRIGNESPDGDDDNEYLKPTFDSAINTSDMSPPASAKAASKGTMTIILSPSQSLWGALWLAAAVSIFAI